jgi:hypothetical protein
MVASIVRTVCPTGLYTLISDGNDKCTFSVPSNYGGRLAMGSSLPAPNVAHYRDCSPTDGPIELGSLGAVKLYYMPNNVEQTIAAIVG